MMTKFLWLAFGIVLLTGCSSTSHRQTDDYFYLQKKSGNWCYTKVKDNEATAQVCERAGKLHYSPYPKAIGSQPGTIPAPVLALFDYVETVERTGIDPEAE